MYKCACTSLRYQRRCRIRDLRRVFVRALISSIRYFTITLYDTQFRTNLLTFTRANSRRYSSKQACTYASYIYMREDEFAAILITRLSGASKHKFWPNVLACARAHMCILFLQIDIDPWLRCGSLHASRLNDRLLLTSVTCVHVSEKYYIVARIRIPVTVY